MPQILSPATLLTLDGADATTFAQAQFCSDVASLGDGQWQWSSWLDAQGRALYFFALLRITPTRLMAWLPAGDADAFVAQLGRFLFRSRVSLEAPLGWALLQQPDIRPPSPREWLAAGEGFALDIGVQQRRLMTLLPDSSGEVDEVALQAWRRADIDDRLPLLATPVSGQFVPQTLGFETLAAVSHDKGCYPGQEIVARLHFRGGNKRHLYRVAIETSASPAAGEQLRSAQRDRAGTLLYAVPDPGGGHIALAVLSQDIAAEGGLLTAQGDAVHITAEHPDTPA